MIFTQINLHHCKAASDLLTDKFIRGQSDIFLVQEPWIVGNEIKGLGGGGRIVYDSGTQKTRTCVYIKKEIKMIFLPQFSDGDVTAIKLYCQDKSGSEFEVIVCSAYLPYEAVDPPPDKLVSLVNYCQTNNKQLIVGCDANAHHIVWGSSNINSRGQKLLDFIVLNSLNVQNVGSEPTFFNVNRREVIDLTLSSRIISNKIRNWRVLDEPSGSDHRYIQFTLTSICSKTVDFRNRKKTNWEVFNRILSNNFSEVDFNIHNASDLNHCANLFQKTVIDAFENSCKLTTKKSKQSNPWFSEELAELKKKARKLWNKAGKPGADFLVKQAQLKALHEYNAAVKKAREDSWKKNCEDIQNTAECSRLYKLISKDPNRSIGSFRKADGTCTESIKESLKLLLSSHFPDSTEVETDESCDLNSEDLTKFKATEESLMLANSIVTHDSLKWAVNSFEPYKSPGKDGIFPALLQNGFEHISKHLLELFKSSIALAFVPVAWRGTAVTFIPKAGRSSYLDPKSYRPISLMSFLLKTQEKLIDKHIRSVVLAQKPIHSNQFAYQPGKSTEVALHHLVEKIEKTFDNKEMALGAFLDIEGAFDNTSFGVIVDAARKHGVENSIIEWITNMLSSRVVSATLFEETVSIKTTKGCPQGGCLSPLIWCLVVDELLTRLNSAGGIYAQSYADDIIVYVTGLFNQTVADILQKALKIVEVWCKEVKLSVNPSKSTFLNFTKRRVKNLKLPFFYGKPIALTNEVKYLGIILDDKLNWLAHLKKTITKATRSFWATRSIVGRSWGLVPKITLWLYTQVILPQITYGALVWWPRVKFNNSSNQLRSLQRMAELSITGAMKSTPVAAMDILLELPPLHFVVEAKAMAGAHRLASLGLWRGQNNGYDGHTSLNHFLRRESESWLNSDKMLKKFFFHHSFKTEIRTRDEWIDEFIAFEDNSVVCYTDAAKNEFGTGIGVYCDKLQIELSEGISSYATVHQAELFAIDKCAKECLKRSLLDQNIFILSDSQSALKSLGGYVFSSKTAWNCLQSLQELGAQNKVKLLWVPSHLDIEGNEMADTLAKEGRDSDAILEVVPLPPVVINQKINNWLNEKVTKYWQNLPGLEVSKSLIQSIDHKRFQDIIKLNRRDLRILVGLLTGHCPLYYILLQRKIVNMADCRFCMEEDETSTHVLCSCAGLISFRQDCFNIQYLQPNEVCKLSIHNILSFARKSGVAEIILNQ